MAAALPWPCDDWSNEARSFCPSVPSPACWDVASSGSSAWYDCDIEPTTTSLATNPVISAAEACQSSKPAGANTGATASASTPYAESCTSST